jgi:hypothetical protein
MESGASRRRRDRLPTTGGDAPFFTESGSDDSDEEEKEKEVTLPLSWNHTITHFGFTGGLISSANVVILTIQKSVDNLASQIARLMV